MAIEFEPIKGGVAVTDTRRRVYGVSAPVAESTLEDGLQRKMLPALKAAVGSRTGRLADSIRVRRIGRRLAVRMAFYGRFGKNRDRVTGALKDNIRQTLNP